MNLLSWVFVAPLEHPRRHQAAEVFRDHVQKKAIFLDCAVNYVKRISTRVCLLQINVFSVRHDKIVLYWSN